MIEHTPIDRTILDISVAQLQKRWNVSLRTIYLWANEGYFGIYVECNKKRWLHQEATDPKNPIFYEKPYLFEAKEGFLRLATRAELNIFTETGSIEKLIKNNGINFLTFNAFGYILENKKHVSYSYKLKQEPAWHLKEQFDKLHPDYKSCFSPNDLIVFMDQIKRLEATEEFKNAFKESQRIIEVHIAQEDQQDLKTMIQNTIKPSVDELKEYFDSSLKEATNNIISPEVAEDIAAGRNAKKKCSNAGKEGAAKRKLSCDQAYLPYQQKAFELTNKHKGHYSANDLADKVCKDPSIHKIKSSDRLKESTIRKKFSADKSIAPHLKPRKKKQLLELASSGV